MATEPPSSLSYRTTGSTCLHPLSQLLGIPLDQVSAAGRQDPSPSQFGRGAYRGNVISLCPRLHSRCYSCKLDRWAFSFSFLFLSLLFPPVSVGKVYVFLLLRVGVRGRKKDNLYEKFE